MKIAILTDTARADLLREALSGILLPEPRPLCTHFQCYDDFIRGLSDGGFQVTIVAQDGANGMESARAAKILLPEVPLIWLSDDKAFGPESYRLGCAYFSASPISTELLHSALRRCNISCM